MAMNCDIFRSKLDQYMDSELSPAERAEMERHARECESCALLLDRATALATMCAEMNEGLVVPLNAQSAWRQAVRSEAAKKKTAPLSIWSRCVGAVAAALVLLFTGTYGMRIGQPAPERMNAPAAETVDFAENESTADLPHMYAIGVKTSAVPALRSDGSTEEDQVQSRTAQDTVENVFLRSARREILSHSYRSDVEWLENLVKEYDAYFEEHTQTMGETARVLNAVVCVPSDRLDEFLTELEQLGETTLRSESVKDITDTYLTAQAQLAALQDQQASLEALRSDATELADVLAIDEQLSHVQTEIERFTREADGLTSYSRITLVLTEADETASTKAESEGNNEALGARMKTGFDDSVEWLKQFVQDALVVLATAAPRLVVWIPALVIVILLLRAIFRRKK